MSLTHESIARLHRSATLRARRAMSRERAEDFAQEAVLSALSGKKKKLVYQLIDALKKEPRHAELKDVAGRQVDSMRDFAELIAPLPQQSRVAVVLFYVWGFSMREMSYCLGVSENTVKCALTRSRRRLKHETR